jgi:23S rRNA pseudouridine1911/1915/1917 synthase
MFNAMPPRNHQFSVASRCELLPYLMTLPLGLSRKQAKDLLRFRAVTVKRLATVRHDTPLEPGDVVTIAAGKQLPAESIEHQGLKIVHLDDAVAVVEKRAGLLSMGSEGEKEKTAHRILNDHLKAITKSAAQQAFIVHRLDRETSGLMLFARSRAIQTALQQNWKTVTKKYLAVVEGVPAKAEDTLRDHLVESKSLKMHRVERGGELAITHYRVLRTGRNRSLVEFTLETGRKNQIRVQIAGLGHPIVGDRKYGAASDPARRLALHSSDLKFHHPATGAAMEFRSAMPGSLMALIDRRERD